MLIENLVPGRECGECTLCCIAPAIDKPEIQKQGNSVCKNCVNHGCAIYDDRPQLCRNYYCGWRRLEIFGDDWRPDKSGVFAELETDIPPQFQSSVGISLILVGNPLKTIRQPWFMDFVARGIDNNVALFLGLTGPKGMQCARLPLNTRELYAASRVSRSEMRLVLEKILRRLTTHNFIPHVMENSGHDWST